jgi:hypothetical protein
MNGNPMISIAVADRLAQLRREADQERLGALGRSASNRGRSGRGDRRTRYVAGVRVWLSGAVRAVATAVRADRQGDCPDEAAVGRTSSAASRWNWTPDRSSSPCP